MTFLEFMVLFHDGIFEHPFTKQVMFSYRVDNPWQINLHKYINSRLSAETDAIFTTEWSSHEGVYERELILQDSKELRLACWTQLDREGRRRFAVNRLNELTAADCALVFMMGYITPDGYGRPRCKLPTMTVDDANAFARMMHLKFGIRCSVVKLRKCPVLVIHKPSMGRFRNTMKRHFVKPFNELFN